MLKEATDSLTFPSIMKQGIITLIPKPGKDPKILDNLRPITLWNNNCTIVTLIYTNRLKKHLDKIFMTGRSIHNNICLVLHLLDYLLLIEDDCFILFLDL